MFKNEDDLKETVSRLNIDDNPNPIHRERLREQMLSVFAKAGEQPISQSKPLWKTIVKNPIMKLAAAAVLVMAVLWGIHHVGGQDTASVALASVIDNMKKAPWIQWVTTEYHNGKEAEQHYYWINFSSKKGFYKFKDSFWCFDYDKGKQYHYKSSDETIQVEELSENGFYGTDSAISFVEEFIRWAKSDQFQVTQYKDTLNGEKAEFFELTKSYPDQNMENTACIFNITLIVSQQSQLLIGGGAERRRLDEADKTVTYDWQISYPESGPEDLYALGVPRTAKVIDTREVFVTEAKNGPTLVSTPKPTTGPEMAALDIKLPRAMFVGTPEDIKVARLEKPLGKPRPPFYAPVGTKNVALGKEVTSTDEEPIIGEIEMITDGDKEGVDGSYVEMGPLKQHVTIDLGAEHDIYAIVVWHFHKQPRVYFDVVAQVASDPDFTSNVTTVFNNDIDNSLGFGVGKDMHYVDTNEGRLIDAKGVRARYVRFHSNGNSTNDLNHYIEVEVYGKAAADKPVSAPDEKKDQQKSDNGDTENADTNTAKSEMAPLPIKLPRPMFVGTPQDIKVANLEKPLGKPRSPFFAPVGTKNVALGKKVTSTDEMPIIGEIEMITDGDKEGSDGSYLELGPFKQHITIDLGAEHDIYAIVVWHFHKQARVYFDVVVQVASEPNFVKPKTLFNNDIDNSLKFGAGKNMHYVETSEGKLIDAKGTRGRYVRLYSQGNTHDDLNHYIEVEVYGKAVTDKPESATDEKKDQIKSDKGDTEKTDPNTPKTEMAPLQIKLPTPLFIGTPQNVRVPYLKKPLGKPRPPFYAPVGTKNVALGKPVTCTDEEPIIGETEMITDGDKEGSDGSFIELGPSPQSVTVDLEAMYDIYAIVVWHYHKEAWVFFDVVVQVADDSDFITNVRTLFNNDIDNSLGLGVGKNMHYTETAEGKLIDAKGVRARYVRLQSNGSTGSDANHYIEVEVYGKTIK